MSVKIRQYPGTPLEEEGIKSGRVLSVRYQPKAKYVWSAGVAIGRYLTELRNGRLIGRKCDKCGRIVVPPRMFCEWCFRPNDRWVTLKDTGVVNTFSVSYIAGDASRVKEPLIPAVIQIDETTDAGILHLIGEADPKKVEFGMPVQAVWKPPEERTGSITDIKYFKPIRRLCQ